MKVHIQHITSIIRIWNTDNAEYGDPYEWSATIVWLSDKKIEIIGVDKPVTKSIWIALNNIFYDMGIDEVTFERYTGDKQRSRSHKPKPKKGE